MLMQKGPRAIAAFFVADAGLLHFCYIVPICMTPRCVSKLRPIKQRANLFAGD
jgi:hypothetical protein